MSAVASEAMPRSAATEAVAAAAVEPIVPSAVEAAAAPDAATRLSLSRDRLRAAMTVPTPPVRPARTPRAVGDQTSPLVERGLGLLRGVSAKARALPAADVLIDAVETWWAAHPLHTAGAMAAEASKAYVQPVARRNPIALVAGSAVVGALFFLTRPWRWALRPVLLAGLLPQIVSHALRRAPVGSWVDIATAFARRQSAAKVRRPRAVDPLQTPMPAGPGSPAVRSAVPAQRRD